MSIRSLAVCAILICAAGCYKQEQVNAVQHPSAWQRQAGESPTAAAAIVKQSEKNTQDLNQAIQSGNSDQLAAMSGKLVSLKGDLAEQSDSCWTLKNDAGWTIVAPVNDLTPHSDLNKSQVSKCGAQGIIQSIDSQNKRIVLADVELAPEMKGQFAENVATK
jgi:hypothetical protein